MRNKWSKTKERSDAGIYSITVAIPVVDPDATHRRFAVRQAQDDTTGFAYDDTAGKRREGKPLPYGDRIWVVGEAFRLPKKAKNAHLSTAERTIFIFKKSPFIQKVFGRGCGGTRFP